MDQKHLYRSTNDKKIAGVAGGLADYLNIDSTFVRLLWLVSIFIGGSGVLAYIIAWIAIPLENHSMVGDKPQLEKDHIEQYNREILEKQKKSSYIGLLLIVVGGYFLVKEFLPWNLTRYTWPFILITVGIFLLTTRHRNSSRT